MVLVRFWKAWGHYGTRLRKHDRLRKGRQSKENHWFYNGSGMIPAGRGRQPVRLIPVMGGSFLRVGRGGGAGGAPAGGVLGGPLGDPLGGGGRGGLGGEK